MPSIPFLLLSACLGITSVYARLHLQDIESWSEEAVKDRRLTHAAAHRLRVVLRVALPALYFVAILCLETVLWQFSRHH